MTPYTYWLRSTDPKARVFVAEVPHDRDSSLALTARRLGVKVSTSRGVAVYGLDTAPVVRVVKED